MQTPGTDIQPQHNIKTMEDLTAGIGQFALFALFVCYLPR